MNKNGSFIIEAIIALAVAAVAGLAVGTETGRGMAKSAYEGVKRLIGVDPPPSPPSVIRVDGKIFSSFDEGFASAITSRSVAEALTNALPSDVFSLSPGTILSVKTNDFTLPEISASQGYRIQRSDNEGIVTFRTLRVLPEKEVVDDLRVLWSYERNFAYDARHTASSMEELGDGSGIGKNGHVLKAALWAARIEAGDACEPVHYGQPGAHRPRYRFGIFPLLSDAGEKERIGAVLAAIPPSSDASDACFLAICGPANLSNDFSFDKAWPVYILRAEQPVLESILSLADRPKTPALLEELMTSGDLSPFLIRHFIGWYGVDEP